MTRSPERLIQLARSVNDAVVGQHIGQLCRDLADALEASSALPAIDAVTPLPGSPFILEDAGSGQ